MNGFQFRAKEREAFAQAYKAGFSDDIELEPPPPQQISKETIQGFRKMEESLDEMWKSNPILTEAAKTKPIPKDHKGYKDKEKLVFNGHIKRTIDIVDGITPDIIET